VPRWALKVASARRPDSEAWLSARVSTNACVPPDGAFAMAWTSVKRRCCSVLAR